MKELRVGQRIVVRGTGVFGGKLDEQYGVVVRLLERSRQGGAMVRMDHKLPAGFLYCGRAENDHEIDLYPDECEEAQ
jgi:hypothetical protein